MDILNMIVWIAAITFCLFVFAFIFAGAVIVRAYRNIKNNMRINSEKDRYRKEYKW